MNIAFIGAGYVGLTSGVLMAHLGHKVLCIDANADKIAKLNLGRLPIYEPGLEEYTLRLLGEGALTFCSKYDKQLAEVSTIFIAVGTPPLPSGDADLSQIYSAIDSLAFQSNPNALIVIKSTVPPGTCSKLQQYIWDKKLTFRIASNPEFLREGVAIHDFLNPHRIVVGARSDEDADLLRRLYAPLIEKTNAPLLATNLETAELIKYASNSFLATKIAFINQISDICEKVGANIEDVSKGMGQDSRIGNAFLKVGPGFGGSCFPKDILALSNLYKQYGIDFTVLDAVIDANNRRTSDMVKKIDNIVGGVKGKKIAILGLAFKAGTDDLRDSPAVKIAQLLQAAGAQITAYDPKAMENSQALYPNIGCTNSAIEACAGCRAVVICTEWEEFRLIDFPQETKIIIDLRNILDVEDISLRGINYYPLGKQ